MTVLLTGGAGFIGSHTAVELLSAGYDPIVADNFSNSRPDVARRMERIAGRAVPLFAVDVSCPRALERVFASNAIDAVIHFAGYKAVGESVAKPVMYYRNNLDAALTLLETMDKYGVKKIVFSSSAAVYGTPARVPIQETDPAGDCTNPYGRTKFYIEQILTDAANADPELSVVLLRYFNPVGAHESGLIGEWSNGIPNNLLPYIAQTAAGLRKKLSVYGGDYPTRDGTGVRDYIHVVDLAKGHIAALRYAGGHPGVEVFNLGTGSGSSVLEIVRAFERATGAEVPYQIAPRRPGDVAECYADTKKAERVLGWKAGKSLEDMCRDAWRWQQSYHEIEKSER